MAATNAIATIPRPAGPTRSRVAGAIRLNKCANTHSPTPAINNAIQITSCLMRAYQGNPKNMTSLMVSLHQ
jgi:hypothetical protein